MLEQLKKMMRDIAGDNELFKLMAEVKKKTNDALIAEGFTEEQALQITISGGDIIKTS